MARTRAGYTSYAAAARGEAALCDAQRPTYPSKLSKVGKVLEIRKFVLKYYFSHTHYREPPGDHKTIFLDIFDEFYFFVLSCGHP